MGARFIAELDAVLANYDEEKALDLTQRIHDAEANGYKVGLYEDRRWAELSDHIGRKEGK